MKILGVAAPFSHDSSASLIVDGKVVAAVEEERFTRKKHEGDLPIHSIKYCLESAGLTPAQIDIVAFPWSVEILKQRKVEYFLKSVWKKPSPAFKKLMRTKKEFNDRKKFVNSALTRCGFDLNAVKIHWIEHQLAHVASSLHLSGMKESAFLSIDAGGEITSTLLGYTKNGKIIKIKEMVSSDSIGNFYSTMTDYLGFKRGNGEYKVMGMAPYGDPTKVNFDHIMWWNDMNQTYRCDEEYVWVTRDKRFRVEKVYSKKMVEEFGPERQGDGLSEPYIHIAAQTQHKLEEITLKLIDTYLKNIIEESGNLCFAGGCALNVALNRKLLELPYLKRLWVQPAAHDSGTSLGAAAFVAKEIGEQLDVMEHPYLGPEYSNDEIKKELDQWSYPFSLEKNISQKVADLLDKGEIVGWFQGRMEWGPRALGARSILGNPTVKGTADKINAIIKFREKWRPFCPSILKEKAKEILSSDHPAPFMTIAFKVNASWRDRIPEVVHVDDTCRPQLVDQRTNPRFHDVISKFYEKTGVPLLINTSLNRRGEPVVCSPKDALKMFEGSGLTYLALGDFLVRKS